MQVAYNGTLAQQGYLAQPNYVMPDQEGLYLQTDDSKDGISAGKVIALAALAGVGALLIYKLQQSLSKSSNVKMSIRNDSSVSAAQEEEDAAAVLAAQIRAKKMEEYLKAMRDPTASGEGVPELGKMTSMNGTVQGEPGATPRLEIPSDIPTDESSCNIAGGQWVLFPGDPIDAKNGGVCYEKCQTGFGTQRFNWPKADGKGTYNFISCVALCGNENDNSTDWIHRETCEFSQTGISPVLRRHSRDHGIVFCKGQANFYHPVGNNNYFTDAFSNPTLNRTFGYGSGQKKQDGLTDADFVKVTADVAGDLCLGWRWWDGKVDHLKRSSWQVGQWNGQLGQEPPVGRWKEGKREYFKLNASTGNGVFPTGIECAYGWDLLPANGESRAQECYQRCTDGYHEHPTDPKLCVPECPPNTYVMSTNDNGIRSGDDKCQRYVYPARRFGLGQSVAAWVCRR